MLDASTGGAPAAGRCRARRRRWRRDRPSFAALLAATLAWLEAAGRRAAARRRRRSATRAIRRRCSKPPTRRRCSTSKGRVELLAAAAIAIVGSRNPTRAGAGERPRLRPPPEPRRAGRRLGAGARHRRRGARGRAGRRAAAGRRHDRRRRHRARPRLPGAAPGAGAPHRRRGPDRQRIPDRHASLAGELPDPQPHHRRPGARHAGGRGGAAARAR